MGIDISVLSWTKRKARKEKNSEIRHVLKRGAKKKEHVHDPVGFLRPPNDRLSAHTLFWPGRN